MDSKSLVAGKTFNRVLTFGEGYSRRGSQIWTYKPGDWVAGKTFNRVLTFGEGHSRSGSQLWTYKSGDWETIYIMIPAYYALFVHHKKFEKKACLVEKLQNKTGASSSNEVAQDKESGFKAFSAQSLPFQSQGL